MILTCTFTKRSGNFMAAVKYEIMPESEEMCLKACYEESDCIYLQYFQDACTVYKSGSEEQNERGSVFEVDRVQSDSSCTRRIVVEATVDFKSIAPNTTNSIPCNGVPMSTTTINVFKGNQYRFYTTKEKILPDGSAPFRRFR
ncbi:hypothetical protein Y032_0067g68 [Ancylostoma ceylanicum]|uniref:PAN domain protein n=1 Tax=Ancylostoma ceylanicum TaxID=53326 RepID=A0A016TZM7_9BILA|nr:hypothetical protein Y032_0067g68 [Ancylostoma ceylanicum]